MCHHYCATLEGTLLYHCLSMGGSRGECAERSSGTTERCYELRCVPKLVALPLCFTQCDALAGSYRSFCAAAPAPEPLCPSSAADHDRICRAGCR
jgi:hypothetical protein